jgi:Secretion system C-terminal sorting domain
MKNKIFFLFLLLPALSFAQAKKESPVVCAYYFDYDASGHRIKRYYQCDTKDPVEEFPIDEGDVVLANPLRLAPPTPSTALQQGTVVLANELTENAKRPTLFPNPTTDKAKVSWADAGADASITLLDASGKVLSISSFGTGEVDLATYSAGLYFVVVQKGEISHKLPVIKH